jgi:hypothetical protein
MDEEEDDEFARFDQEQVRKALLLRNHHRVDTTLPSLDASHLLSIPLPLPTADSTTFSMSRISGSPETLQLTTNNGIGFDQSPPLPPLSPSPQLKASLQDINTSLLTQQQQQQEQSFPTLQHRFEFSPPETLSIQKKTPLSTSLLSSNGGTFGSTSRISRTIKSSAPVAIVKAKKKSRSGLCRQLCSFLIKMEFEL